MKKRCLFALGAGVLCFAGAVSAADASVGLATESVMGGNGEVGWLWTLLTMPEIEALLLAFLGAVVGLLTRWNWVRKWRLERAVQCIAAGVRETYEEYVREIQKARQDGKLSSEERSLAMRMALEKAKEYARREGFELIKAYAEEFLPVIVERVIGAQKAAARGQSDVEPLSTAIGS